MKQTKLISLLLVICLVAALLVPGTVAMEAKAADGEENDGLVVNKTAEANGDGTYTITLEAYATGESVTSSTEKDVPTDIILVLDDSGSMAYDFSTVTDDSFVRYYEDNSTLYNCRHNQDSYWVTKNLWYKVEEEYRSVSVERESIPSYKEYSGKTNSTYYNDSNNLYLKTTDGTYLKIDVRRSGGVFNRTYTYTWSGGSLTSDGGYETPNFSQYGTIFLQSSDYQYTYSYTVDGNKTVIETSVGADNSPNNAFYKKIEGGRDISRIDALKSALDGFVSSVNAKAKGPDGEFGTGDDVKHRVAVVSFASDATLLTDGLEDMTTEEGRNSVNAAFYKLAANGATRADLGMSEANSILNGNPPLEGEKRNRVVIFFTDGEPTSGNSFEMWVANGAINTSTAIKGLGAKVYSVGIFDGANATDAGYQYGNDTQKSNWFMQNVSSNGGTPQSPSFYLSAADAGTLNSIFQQISDQIQEGGSSIELGAEAVVRDEISPYFKLPDDATSADINLSLVPCTGVNQSGELTWGGSETAEGVSATVDGRNISVTGFDFSENWCGPRTDAGGTATYGGKKLVISFKVVAEPLFLGGNNVPTNASAGIYKKPDDTEPLKNFPVPEVNVPIKDITVTAGDKNVYLLGDLTKDQLTSDATVKAGENIVIDLDPTAENYGLETWQNEFVKIEASLSDSEEKPLENGFTGLKEDTAYNLTVKVSPKYEGTASSGTVATAKTGEDTADVNVFKPEITWKDTCIDAGETPVYKSDEVVEQNFVSLNWKHGETISTGVGVTMIGSEPTLSYTYDPEATMLTEETPVKVAVKIDDQDVTTDSVFVHDPCTFDNCKWETKYKDEGYHFVVHLNTFDLTIKKVVQDANLDPNQTFVFTVEGPNDFSMEVIIKGNGSTTITNLPAGDYTVTEDTGWSWRYTPSGNELIGNPERPEVTFSNTRTNDNWLDGNAYCENEFIGTAASN